MYEETFLNASGSLDVIINENAIEELESSVEKISKSITEEKENITKIINLFDNEPVVQSFYQSGKFGIENRNKLQDIKNSIEQYEEAINERDGLYTTTMQYLKEMRTRINFDNERW